MRAHAARSVPTVEARDALEASERLIEIPAGAVIGHTLTGVVNRGGPNSPPRDRIDG
jgi:hypothetical protein